MKNLKINGKKLSRESKKNILAGDDRGPILPVACSITGCYDDYFGDSRGTRCVVPPCNPPDYGTIVIHSNGRSQCCY